MVCKLRRQEGLWVKKKTWDFFPFLFQYPLALLWFLSMQSQEEEKEEKKKKLDCTGTVTSCKVSDMKITFATSLFLSLVLI